MKPWRSIIAYFLCHDIIIFSLGLILLHHLHDIADQESPSARESIPIVSVLCQNICVGKFNGAQHASFPIFFREFASAGKMFEIGGRVIVVSITTVACASWWFVSRVIRTNFLKSFAAFWFVISLCLVIDNIFRDFWRNLVSRNCRAT